jgi:hypothetical protein
VRETKTRSNLEGGPLTQYSLIKDAGRDVFGASHLGAEKTRLSDIAYLYQETNDMRFPSIMLCIAGTLVERPFRGLFERAVVHVLPSHFYWREKSHQLDWASCMTVVLRVPLSRGIATKNARVERAFESTDKGLVTEMPSGSLFS